MLTSTDLNGLIGRDSFDFILVDTCSVTYTVVTLRFEAIAILSYSNRNENLASVFPSVFLATLEAVCGSTEKRAAFR